MCDEVDNKIEVEEGLRGMSVRRISTNNNVGGS
jgi:hypothetical protein